MLKKILIGIIAMNCTLSFAISKVIALINDSNHEVKLYQDDYYDTIPAHSVLPKDYPINNQGIAQTPSDRVMTIYKDGKYAATFVDTGIQSNTQFRGYYFGIHDNVTTGYLRCYEIAFGNGYATINLVLNVTDNDVTISNFYSYYFKEVKAEKCAGN